MAVNFNNAAEAKHVCYLAGTGGGKTTAVKLLDLVGDQVAIFDLYGDYQFDGRKKSPFNGLGGRTVYHFNKRSDFAKAFTQAWSSGKKFVLAYQPTFSPTLKGSQLKDARIAELHWFGQLMWTAADGNRELHVIIEELAKLASTAGKDETIIGELATGGRKFGLVLHTIFQRSQEVPKTIWNNSPRKVLGAQESTHDAKLIAHELDAELSDVKRLSQLNQQFKKQRLYYLFKSGGGIGNITPHYICTDTKAKEFGKTHEITFDQLRAV